MLSHIFLLENSSRNTRCRHYSERKEVRFAQGRKTNISEEEPNRSSWAAVELRKEIADFFLRDDISRETTGSKI